MLTPESQGLKGSTEKILNILSSRISRVMADQERVAEANKNIVRTLLRHIDPDLPPGDFSSLPAFDPTMEREDAVLASYLALSSISESLKQCEFYFRRYPFRDLPVSRTDHLRNICEMYFNRVYQFKERLKITLNLLKDLCGVTHDERFGVLIRAFEKALDWELRQRNATHHTKRFEYDAIDQLGLIDILRLSDMAEVLPSQDVIYRQEANKWVKRVRSRSEALGNVVAVAGSYVLEYPFK